MGYTGKLYEKNEITISGVTKEINVNYFAYCKSNPEMADADWFLSAEAYHRSLDLTFRGGTGKKWLATSCYL